MDPRHCQEKHPKKTPKNPGKTTRKKNIFDKEPQLTLRGLNFAVFAVFDKNRKIKSTRNRLKWGQPRNLIHAKFNF